MDMAIKAILILGLMWSFLLALRVLRRLWRRRVASRIGEPVRLAEGVGVQLQLYKTRAIQGMSPARRHSTEADLAITDDQLILASDRGVLLDLGPNRGRRFTAVRCTGPGRLVLEGDAPSTQTTGLYRFELTIEDAGAWAEALRPFVAEGGEVTIHPAVAIS